VGLARLEDDRFSLTCIPGLLIKQLIAEPALLHGERFLLEVMYMHRWSSAGLDNVFSLEPIPGGIMDAPAEGESFAGSVLDGAWVDVHLLLHCAVLSP
jgi:hypothetical protein